MTDRSEHLKGYDEGRHSPLSVNDFKYGSPEWEGAYDRDRSRRQLADLNAFSAQNSFSNSSVSSGGGAQSNPSGMFMYPLVAEICAVGYLAWSYLYPFVNSAMANVTSNPGLWVIGINGSIAIVLAISYAGLQMHLLAKPSTRTLTKLILSIVWSYVFYYLARHWSVTSLIWLSAWTTAGAVISYGEKTLITDSDEIIGSLGFFTAFEIIAGIFVSICTLLQPQFGIQPGYAIAIGVAVGFAYKSLIRSLARTPLVYLIAIASTTFWVALTYWLSTSVMQLRGYWSIGLSLAMLAWVSLEKKRSMVKGFSGR
jgi:hypothetical protein